MADKGKKKEQTIGNNDNKDINKGRFVKGNEIGMETRFKEGNKFRTKYKDEYVDMLYEYYSNKDNIYPTLGDFAAKNNLCIKTLERWVNNSDKYPRMARTYVMCKNIQLQKLLEGGLTRQFDAQIVKFIAVNNHNMKEKVEQEVKADASFKVDISFFDEDSK